MLLSDRDIKQALAAGRIKVDPAPDLALQLGSCSLDLTLGNKFSLFEPARVPYIDTRAQKLPAGMFRDLAVADDQQFIMHPSELVLAITREHLELADDLVGRLEGRSSLARLGIIVHGTSNVFDAGWRGHPVLELGNIGRMPVALYPQNADLLLHVRGAIQPGRGAVLPQARQPFRRPNAPHRPHPRITPLPASPTRHASFKLKAGIYPLARAGVLEAPDRPRPRRSRCGEGRNPELPGVAHHTAPAYLEGR